MTALDLELAAQDAQQETIERELARANASFWLDGTHEFPGNRVETMQRALAEAAEEQFKTWTDDELTKYAAEFEL